MKYKTVSLKEEIWIKLERIAKAEQNTIPRIIAKLVAEHELKQ